MAVVLGIDYGTVRVGLALSTDDGRYAYAFRTIDRERDDLLNALRSICRDEEVSQVVIGLPLDQAGQVGEAAALVQEFGAVVHRELNLPVAYEDERFTTTMAQQLGRAAGYSEKAGRPTIDQRSAQLILQTYLDRTHGTATRT